jgi:uncharacterized membrane protein YkoI
MNRNLKSIVLSAVTIMALGAASVSFAAADPAASAKPDGTQAKKVTTTTTGKTTVKTVAAKKAPKVSQGQATQIALKAHQGATVDSIKLAGKVYVVKLTSDQGKYKMKIGANTGRVIKNSKIATKAAAATKPAGATKSATATKTGTAATPK